MLGHFFFSYQVILDRIVDLLNQTNDVDHDQLKGCLYVLLGNDTNFLPVKHSWVIVEKLWPSIASTKHATKLSTQNLLNSIIYQMCQRYHTMAIVEDTNEISRKAAVNLWRSLDENDLEFYSRICKERNDANIRSYQNVVEKLTSLFYVDQLYAPA